MTKVSRYLLNQRMNRERQMMMGNQPQSRKFGFGSEQETENNNREYYPESRARGGSRRYGNQSENRYGGYDERYGYDMPTYRDERRGY